MIGVNSECNKVVFVLYSLKLLMSLSVNQFQIQVFHVMHVALLVKQGSVPM